MESRGEEGSGKMEKQGADQGLRQQKLSRESWILDQGTVDRQEEKVAKRKNGVPGQDQSLEIAEFELTWSIVAKK